MSTATAVRSKSQARRPQLERDVAMRLAATEYDRVVDQLRSLDADDWTRPSGCPPWDVRDLAAHMLGMAEMAASVREGLRQMRKAKRAGGVFIDALTGLQVAERAAVTPAQLVAGFADAGPRAVKGRRRTPGFVRRRTMPDQQPVGGSPTSASEWWSVGYLVDVILTRDPWMHRTDIAAATGRPLVLTGDHDGVLVADVVADWASRHDEPYRLTLAGPAGGSFARGSGGQELTHDAVTFCRALAGRGPADGLLAVEVPF